MTAIPSTRKVLQSLFRADFTTQWRNRRSFILVLLVPVIILISWKGDMVSEMGGAVALSTSITFGLVAIGLMGYSNSLARDREKGIFQRLRVAPVPTWAIMGSRLFVQLAMIILVTLVVFMTGYYEVGIRIPATGYILATLAAILGGAVYLGLGQVIVGLISNPETVFSTTRLVYFCFIIIGLSGETGALGKITQKLVIWSPYGTVKRLLAAALQPDSWTAEISLALLVTVGYALLFAGIGIRRFQWTSKA